MTVVAFTVNGRPIPQGSKTVGRAKNGRSFVREDNPALDPWRKAVAGQARQAWNRAPILAPVELDVFFTFKRPKSHYTKATGRLTASSPQTPAKAKGTDLDKLIRAVADAITGIVVADDCQIVKITATKTYGSNDHAYVAVAYAIGGLLE